MAEATAEQKETIEAYQKVNLEQQTLAKKLAIFASKTLQLFKRVSLKKDQAEIEKLRKKMLDS